MRFRHYKYYIFVSELNETIKKNLLKISKTNIAISVTGIAGPDGGTKKKPIGLVYVGICSKNKFEIKKFNFGKKLSRINIQNLTLKKTIKLIDNHINTL